MAIATFGRHDGTVTTFDVARGLGTIDGGEHGLLLFHCTAIADGTRTIDAGAAVSFDLVAGRMGDLEAAAIRSAG